MFIWHRERQSHTYSLLIPNWTPESGSWSWHVSLPGDKGPYGLCQAITLCGSTFTCCMLSEYSFILCPWPSWPWGPQALTIQCFRFHSGVVSPSPVSERGAHRPVTLCQLSGVPTSDDGDTHIIGADLALCLLYVSKSVVPSSAWLCCIFLGDFDTKMQWAEGFELWLAVGWTLLSSMEVESSLALLTGAWCSVHGKTWKNSWKSSTFLALCTLNLDAKTYVLDDSDS